MISSDQKPIILMSPVPLLLPMFPSTSVVSSLKLGAVTASRTEMSNITLTLCWCCDCISGHCHFALFVLHHSAVWSGYQRERIIYYQKRIK